MTNLRKTFEKCREAKIGLNPLKSFIGIREGILLGHLISKEGIRVDQDKVKVILALLPPANIRQLRAFLGYVNYYQKFI